MSDFIGGINVDFFFFEMLLFGITTADPPSSECLIWPRFFPLAAIPPHTALLIYPALRHTDVHTSVTIHTYFQTWVIRSHFNPHDIIMLEETETETQRNPTQVLGEHANSAQIVIPPGSEDHG